jgi:cell fate regulator YaaT (PSP1 superfamily)
MVMAVSFTRHGRLHYLDPGSYTPRVGDKVLVPTDTGPEVAECVWAPQHLPEKVGGLPVCAGPASEKHLERDERNRHRKAEARVTAKRLIREHDLPMKVVGVDYLDAENQITIYFSAPHRVDFRFLVRDLARALEAGSTAAAGARDERRSGRYRSVRPRTCAAPPFRLRPNHLTDGQDQTCSLNPQDQRLRPWV